MAALRTMPSLRAEVEIPVAFNSAGTVCAESSAARLGGQCSHALCFQ